MWAKFNIVLVKSLKKVTERKTTTLFNEINEKKILCEGKVRPRKTMLVNKIIQNSLLWSSIGLSRARGP